MPSTTTVTHKELRGLIRRQEKVEQAMLVLKKIVAAQDQEGLIRPSALRRWERISRDLDRGKGRAFSSVKEMRRWLGKL